MDLSEEIKHAVSVTASTMLVENLNQCNLALYENDYILVVQGSFEHSQQTKALEGEFPMADKIFLLYHK